MQEDVQITLRVMTLMATKPGTSFTINKVQRTDAEGNPTPGGKFCTLTIVTPQKHRFKGRGSVAHVAIQSTEPALAIDNCFPVVRANGNTVVIKVRLPAFFATYMHPGLLHPTMHIDLTVHQF
jgi:hypothetical protein